MTETTQTPTVQPGQETVQYLLIALAGKVYGIRFDHLQEVLRYNPDVVAPVPNTVDWLEGILSLRGVIVSAVSLRAFLGLPRHDSNEVREGSFDLGIGFGRSVPRLLVAYQGNLLVGLVVDEIKGVLFVQPAAVTPAASDSYIEYGPVSNYLAGIYTDPETKQSTALLDVQRLITSSTMLQFEPAL
jgi:purine-binding chemotaxis protein CheW